MLLVKYNFFSYIHRTKWPQQSLIPHRKCAKYFYVGAFFTSLLPIHFSFSLFIWFFFLTLIFDLKILNSFTHTRARTHAPNYGAQNSEFATKKLTIDFFWCSFFLSVFKKRKILSFLPCKRFSSSSFYFYSFLCPFLRIEIHSKTSTFFVICVYFWRTNFFVLLCLIIIFSKNKKNFFWGENFPLFSLYFPFEDRGKMIPPQKCSTLSKVVGKLNFISEK